MRRGFKSDATRLAVEVRLEVGLDEFAALDPRALAELYGIPVYPLSEMDRFGCPSETISYYADDQRATFSAALIPWGSARVIVDNDFHGLPRRTSSISHEMSHVVLEHDFVASIIGPDGCRAGNKTVEEEAEWLCGELLITSKAARMMANRGATDLDVARRFGVSPERAAMRMNASGARIIARRAAARRAGGR